MKWIEYVKDYAKKNNIKYGEALKKASPSYQLHKKKEPKAKGKASKPNMSMKINEIKEIKKKSNVAFALEKDKIVQESLEKRLAKEKYIDAEATQKSYTELLLEERGKGASAGDAPKLAKRREAEQKFNIAQLKQDVPIGGAFDEDIIKGVRKTKLTKYKKLKAKVDKDIKDGKVNNREFNGLVVLAKHLAGNSKTNSYAKLVKRLEKQIQSKAYGKVSRTQMRQAQKDSLLDLKLSKAVIQEKGRTQRETISKVYENRVNQLKRLGATQEEAEKVAKEETRSIKEQQDLQRELQLAKFRVGALGKTTGGLSYQQFVEKTAKEKGISYNSATSLIKNGNLFQKYQISAVKASTNIAPQASTIVPQITAPIPQTILDKSKYVNKDGKIKKSSQGVIDRLLAKYAGLNTNKEFYGETKSLSIAKGDLEAINKYKGLGVLTQQENDRLNELSVNMTIFVNGGLEEEKDKGKAPVAPAPAPVAPVVAPPTPKMTKRLVIVRTEFKDKIKAISENLALTMDEKYNALVDFFNDRGYDNKREKAILEKAIEDADEDASGAGFGGSFAVMTEDDLKHDGDEDLEGGALKDTVRDIGKRFSSKLVRKAKEFQEPVNLIISGVGAIKGRNVKTQNTIDAEDRHLLTMTINSYTPHAERGDVDGFRYDTSNSNDEHAVWINDAIKKVVVAYRGSRTQEDWLVSDKHIAKGTLEQSDRYKRELTYTNDLVSKIPNDYEIEFTGSSLGGTLAYTLGHATKQRAVVFNPGVGIDGADKHGEDNTKMYHAQGDPISIMGLGKFKDSRMVNNTAGNFAVAHSTSVFQTPSEGGFSKGEHPEDHSKTIEENVEKEKQIKSLENVEATEAKIDDTTNTPQEQLPNPSHYGDLGDFVAGGQSAVENMTQRDIDTYTDSWGGGLPIGDSSKSFANIAKNKIADIKNEFKKYESMYSPQIVSNELGGGFDIDSYLKFKDEHDIRHSLLNKKIENLQNFKKRTKGNMNELVNTHLKHFQLKMKHNNENIKDFIPYHLDKHLNNTLGHDRRRLNDLHIHGIQPNGGSFVGGSFKNYEPPMKHHEQFFKNNFDEEAHKKMGKIVEKLGSKIMDKIKGGGLSQRDHLKILDVSGKHLNKLKLNPHFSHFIVKNAPKNLVGYA